jgi:hypothetical protein
VADTNSQAGLQIFFYFTLNISQLNMKVKRNVNNWDYIIFHWNFVTNSSKTMMATNNLLFFQKHFYMITRIQYKFSYWPFVPRIWIFLR